MITKSRSVLVAGLLCSALLQSAAAYGACTPSSSNRPVCPAKAKLEAATFIDPTASLPTPTGVTLGTQTYVGPFASLTTPRITVGSKTNLQDNVRVDGSGTVTLGDEVILAHGARVSGTATIGRATVAGEHNAAFVGFNSWVEGATVEHDAMVLHLARVAPGITVHHGKVVLSGKNVTSQAQADDPALGKVVLITDALRLFMDGVLHVNETFAREYTRLYRDGATNVTGINYDPSDGGASPSFNPTRDLPVLAGASVRDPSHRNRIIGAVTMTNSVAQLNETARVGNGVALRADEGDPFKLGNILAMGNNTTFHALEHTGIDAGADIRYGARSIVHGGKSDATVNNPHHDTVLGGGNVIGDHAVVFRSTLKAGDDVGCGSLVDGSTTNGSDVGSRLVVINKGHPGAVEYPVEWNPGCP